MAINPLTLPRLTQGAAREPISQEDVAALRRSGALVEDARRERPRYFDGRFLAARDLIRDQQYFLTREADLGRSAGSGVANGLSIDAGTTPHSLHIAPGHGVTPAGELVMLPTPLTVNLADIPAAEQLSARFGLGRIPAAPLRSRTGLYVLALRPVEFTANPIGAYPTTLTGPRTVEDGDVIEATAVVLVPWQDDGAADALEARRGRAARSIFTADGRTGVSDNVLPLAMIALQSNTLVWIDEAMVRRELGADRGDLPGLGFAPRALRLAHLVQHQTHLADVVAQMRGRPFAAATQFPALPPAGPLPPGAIDTRDFTQRYFPAEVDVDFSVIPDDELPALVEESLALPPIDFLASEAALDLTAVLVLAPVPRAEFRSVLARLQSRQRTLKPAAANLVAQRKPLEILQRLRLPLPLAAPDLSTPSDAEWARLANLSGLWYVRRRNLAYRDDLAGAPVAVIGRNEVIVEREVRERIDRLGLTSSLDSVLANSSTLAAPRVINLLATPRVASSQALTAATLGALAARRAETPTLDQAAVLAVAAELGDQAVGEGLVRLERSAPDGVDRAALARLAGNDEWRALDATARTAPEAEVGTLARRLVPMPAVPASRTAEADTEAPAKTRKKPAAQPAMPEPTPAKPAAKRKAAAPVAEARATSPAKSSQAAARQRAAVRRPTRKTGG